MSKSACCAKEGCKYISLCQSLVTPNEFYCAGISVVRAPGDKLVWELLIYVLHREANSCPHVSWSQKMKKDNNKKNKKNKKRERKNRKKKATRNAFIIYYCLIIGDYSGFGKSHVNTRCPTMQATCWRWTSKRTGLFRPCGEWSHKPRGSPKKTHWWEAKIYPLVN